jgi:hypothetical protein
MPHLLALQFYPERLHLDAGHAGFIAIAVLLTIAGIVVHVAAAIAVFSETMAHSGAHGSKVRAILLPAPIWVLAVLLTGLFGLAIYWAMHHSTLNAQRVAKVVEPPVQP